MFKTGLVSISFRGHTAEEIIAAMQRAGLSAVEWGSDVHARPDDEARLAEIKKLCDKAGIYISSYGSYFKLGVDDLSDIYKYIRAARILGTDIIRIWCGSKNYTDMTEDERVAFISLSKEAAAIAEREGVKLCMECHNNTFTNCIEGAVRLMEEVASDNFLMHWQPNQFMAHADNVIFAEKMAKYTRVIHAFHWIGKDKFPLSEGHGRWVEYLSRFSGCECVLLEFMPDGNIATLAREAAELNKIVSEVK